MIVNRHGAATGFSTTFIVLACCILSAAGAAGQASTTDRLVLSRRVFAELSGVFTHPRCLNCHTSVDHPRQGDDQHRHTFNVKRGSDDMGAAAMRCSACHQAANQDASGVPGAPGWRLAPLRMMWDGLSPGQLCRALLDPKRGGMTPASLVAHLDSEKLVAWAWQPGLNSLGAERRLPPLSHGEFIALARKWADLGAACPDEARP
jgi:hypothetical protein